MIEFLPPRLVWENTAPQILQATEKYIFFKESGSFLPDSH